MGIGAGQIGFGHQFRDLGGIRRRQPEGGQRVTDEGFDDFRREPVIRVMVAGGRAVIHQ